MVHRRYLEYVWNTAMQRKGNTFITKVRAHQKSNSQLGMWNNRVDKLAKEAAVMLEEGTGYSQ